MVGGKEVVWKAEVQKEGVISEVVGTAVVGKEKEEV